jgi:hypothetical protein
MLVADAALNKGTLQKQKIAAVDKASFEDDKHRHARNPRLLFAKADAINQRCHSLQLNEKSKPNLNIWSQNSHGIDDYQ